MRTNLKFLQIYFGTVALILLLIDSTHAQEPLIRDSLQNRNTDFHFQFTTVTMRKSRMHAPYSGSHSLLPASEMATTLTSTIFYGKTLWKNAAFYINPEIAGGSGVSLTQGMGGFPNGEAFRVGQPAPSIYLARLFFQQTIALTDQTTEVGLGANDVYKSKPTRYVDIIVGKFSIADYFDRNTYSHDPRSQFLNWSIMSAGGWDYPANVRGYTWGIVTELGLENFSLRFAGTLMPATANGNDINKNPSKAFGSAAELEQRFVVSKRHGTIRGLIFYNSANMGNYNLAIINNAQQPDIISTRAYGRSKKGFILNGELQIGKATGFFFRYSRNDGKNETWAFTEIDRSFSSGLQINGEKWQRPEDQIGIAGALNGLSRDHRNYLASGGSGFMLGDGILNYGLESIVEVYYRANLFTQGFFITPNIQGVVNPGYNIDRGPALFLALRVHIEF